MKIRYMKLEDKTEWYKFDEHLPEAVFEEKVRTKQGYVILENKRIVGILRYNLFWDNTPFCTMLFIDAAYRSKGCGSRLMKYWEKDMKSQGYGMLMTSTQADEAAQHFYRKIGYKDCGGFVVDIPKYKQPMELIMIKAI